MQKLKEISIVIIKYLVMTIQNMGTFAKKIWIMFQEYHQEEVRSLALRNAAMQNEQTAFALANEIISYFRLISSTVARYNIDPEGIPNMRFLGTTGQVFLFGMPKKNIHQDMHPRQLDHLIQRLNQDVALFQNYVHTYLDSPGLSPAYPYICRGIRFIEAQDNVVEIVLRVKI
jgi:hypothetical protein